LANLVQEHEEEQKSSRKKYNFQLPNLNWETQLSIE